MPKIINHDEYRQELLKKVYVYSHARVIIT